MGDTHVGPGFGGAAGTLHGILRVRLSCPSLALEPGLAARADLRALALDLLGSLAEVATTEPLFSRSPQALDARLLAVGPGLEDATGLPAPDLNAWRLVRLAPGVSVEEGLLAVAGLPQVELALPFLLPEAEPPAPTANFQADQLYLGPSPAGFGADRLRGWPESLGRHRDLGVVEWGGDPLHEELAPLGSRLAFDIPSGVASRVDGHANATLGILAAAMGGGGIEGFARQAKLKVCLAAWITTSSGQVRNWSDAVDRASASLGAGDVLLVEVQGYNGWPVEHDTDIFDACKLAVAAGVHVVLPAGNGTHDLDGTIFDAATRDSGAIYVGAAAAPNSSSYTPRSHILGCYGARVDVQGHGEQVVSLAHSGASVVADKYYPTSTNHPFGDPTRAYTQSYGGTSSASALVAGVVALAAELADRLLGAEMSPTDLRNLVRAHGTQQQYNARTRPIGDQPDLASILDELRRRAVRGLPSAGPPVRSLTAKQQDALECLATGLTYQEGATALGISKSAFGSRAGAVYKNLGVSGRLAAIQSALENSLL